MSQNDRKVLLKVRNLKQYFPLKKKGLYVKANDGIDVEIYEGELYNSGDLINGSSLVNWLHRDYLESVYAYIELLKTQE